MTEPKKNPFERAREERDAAARVSAEEAAAASERESERAWLEMQAARERAEEMGDRVEEGTRETGTGSLSKDEGA